MAGKHTTKPKREPKPKSDPKAGTKAKSAPKATPTPEPKPAPHLDPAPPAMEARPDQAEKHAMVGVQDAHQEKDAAPPPEPQPTDSPDLLPAIRKVLEDHMLMEYLSDCEFRLDTSTAKHGDTYRLYVDDYPTDMAIVWNGGRCTVGNKTHASPSDAAWAVCNDLLARVRAAANRK